MNWVKQKKWIDRLIDHYYKIYNGIGPKKSPSCTVLFLQTLIRIRLGEGVQQPGMTGQVKEDLLSRSGELGVRVKEGILCFDPELLRSEEFLDHKQVFYFINIHQKKSEILLAPKSMAFTVCQVPVVYQKSDENVIEVHAKDGSVTHLKGKQLNFKISQAIFRRSGKYEKIVVFLDSIN